MRVYNFMIILFFITFLPAEEIKNSNLPLKGTWNFDLKKCWEISEFNNKVFAKISCIRVKNGKIFVWDNRQFKMFVFNENGKFQYSFIKEGAGPGEVMDAGASKFFLKDNKVIIHEMNTGRVNYYSHEGRSDVTKRIKKHRYANYVQAYLDSNNFVFFLSEGFIKNEKGEWGIYNIPNNEIKKIGLLPKNEKLCIKEKNLEISNSMILPQTIFACAKGKILYGRNNRYQIKILDFKKGDKKIFSIQGKKKDTLKEEDKIQIFNYLKSFAEKKYIDQIIKNTPNHITNFEKITIDKRGHIYVFVPKTKKNLLELDIFSKEGKYLYNGTVKIPDEFDNIRNFTLYDMSCYLSSENKNGDISLVKFRIKLP